MASRVLHEVEGGRLAFWCPGCGHAHVVKIAKPNGWTWNGSYERPTISPSILVRGTRDITDDEHARIMRGEHVEPAPLVCHSYVRDGNIEYLSDCLHSLAGNIVPLEPF